METINATKNAIELAKRNKQDITTIKGTGPNGKITVRDVKNAFTGTPAGSRKKDMDDLNAARQEIQKDAQRQAKKKAAKKGPNATPGAISAMEAAGLKPAQIKDRTGAGGKITATDVKKVVKARAEKERVRQEREEARAAKKAETEARKKEREEARRQKEEAKAKAEAEKQEKVDKRYDHFQKFEPQTNEAYPINLIAPWSADGAESRTTESVKMLGAASSISLRLLPEKDRRYKKGFRAEVIDGNRRLTDYVGEGHDTTPADIFPAEMNKATFHAMRLLSNEARSSNPIHTAESAEVIMKETSWLQKDVAAFFSIPIPRFSKTMKLLTIREKRPKLYAAVKKGKIVTGAAFEMVNCTDEQFDALESILKDTGKVKIVDVRAVRKKDKADQLDEVPEASFEDGTGVYGMDPTDPVDAFQHAAIVLYKHIVGEGKKGEEALKELHDMCRTARSIGDSQLKTDAPA